MYGYNYTEPFIVRSFSQRSAKQQFPSGCSGQLIRPDAGVLHHLKVRQDREGKVALVMANLAMAHHGPKRP